MTRARWSARGRTRRRPRVHPDSRRGRGRWWVGDVQRGATKDAMYAAFPGDPVQQVGWGEDRQALALRPAIARRPRRPSGEDDALTAVDDDPVFEVGLQRPGQHHRLEVSAA